MSGSYCPKRGDIVWLDCDPQAGREMKGRRPTLVLSPEPYNGRVGLVICCPVTNRIKGYPFEVHIPHGLKVTGAILADQVRCYDWKIRSADYCCAVGSDVMEEVLGRLAPLLGCTLS